MSIKKHLDKNVRVRKSLLLQNLRLLCSKFLYYYLVAGFMLDRVQFRVLMPVISLLLTVNLASIYFVAQQSFFGLILCVWLIYLLGFAHFATIPAQVIRKFSIEKVVNVVKRER